MSRIEEASRRVAGSPGAVAERSSRSHDGLPSGSAALDRYAPETSPLQERPGAGSYAPRLSPIGSTASAAGPRAPVELREAVRRAPDGGGKLVIDPDASPIYIEQYRRLAATLYQAQVEGGLKSVMISSALPREGKTLTAANLALTLSESYSQRVVLVDADLRAPAVHTAFGLPNGPGLTEYLRGGDARLPTLEVSSRLSLVTAGFVKGDPIAGLVSDRMAALLKEAAARFDWVIVDTPPVGLLPDANLLARLTDAVLFVVAAGASPHAMVQRAVAALGADRILGVVLNRAADSVLPHSTYYSHYSEPIERVEPVS